MTVGLVDLLDPNCLPPIYELLSRYLDSVSIVRLRRTCKRLLDLPSRMWDVDKVFQRFVSDCPRFRRVMKETGAVVSGGLALQFLDRVVWPESDMDIFYSCNAGVDGFLSYFICTEGYTVETNSGEEDVYDDTTGGKVSLYRSLFFECC